jgi:acyl-CoA synthetase (AMP-forming)/AMP-acid ligase II
LRHAPTLARIEHGVPQVILIETQFDAFLSGVLEDDPLIDVDPEQGLVILYTSGTTGLPKGAVISQRAMVARAMCFRGEYGIGPEHSYVAWSPLFHMAATDFSLATLMIGGKVVVQDGLDVDRLCADHRRRAASAGWWPCRA